MNNTTTEKRLYKSTITIEVLSKTRVEHMKVQDIMDEVYNGEFSLLETNFKEVHLDEKKTTEAMKAHNVDSDFFFWVETE